MNDTTVALLVTGGLVVLVAVITALVHSRNGSTRNLLQGIGLALVPVGLFLTGLMTLLLNGINSLVDWLQRTPMTTLMWVGVGAIGLGVVLWVVASFIKPVSVGDARDYRLGKARAAQAGKSAGKPASGRPADVKGPDKAAGKPAVGGGRPAPAQGGKNAGLSDEDAEIEAMLRARGIE